MQFMVSRPGSDQRLGGRRQTAGEVWRELSVKLRLGLAPDRDRRFQPPGAGEGAINGESFLLYVEKVLAPALEPGDIVIMDNLGSHRAKAIRAAIRAVGARLFFPPKYSPDLNPIEMFFAMLKHGLRKAARRSSDAIYNAIAAILPDVSPNEFANFFAPRRIRAEIKSSRSSGIRQRLGPSCGSAGPVLSRRQRTRSRSAVGSLDHARPVGEDHRPSKLVSTDSSVHFLSDSPTTTVQVMPELTTTLSGTWSIWIRTGIR